jgi:Na+-driven multidrug efflux pump
MEIILAIHNILRWVVLVLGILALVIAYRGWLGRRSYEKSDRMPGLLYTISLDIQVLLGLILYFGRGWINSLTGGNLMDVPHEVRFFAVEHILVMVLAMIAAHVASVLARRAPEAWLKHRRAAIWFTVSFLLVLVGIPWWRPFFPGLG